MDNGIFPTDGSSLGRIRALVRRLGAGAEWPERDLDDVVLAVSEAASNAILHSGGSLIRLAWLAEDGCIDILVRDDGVFSRTVDPSDTGPHGIELMTALMDEVSIQEGTERRPGTVVRLVKCRQPTDARGSTRTGG